MYLLTEEQSLIQNMVREFSDKEIKPIAGEADRTHTFPWPTVRRMAELGLFGLTVPEEYGGSEADIISKLIAVEEISRNSAAHGSVLATHTSLCIDPILMFGTEEQKSRYLPALVRGEKLGAFCLTEAGAGSDSSAITTTAVRKNDTYILNGSKIFITNGGVAEVFIVFAMTEPSKGLKGISSFIVEKGFPGFSVGRAEDKMGIRASSTTEILFTNCEVPAENLLREENNGFKQAMKILDSGRLEVAAQALGIAQGALDASIAFTKERVQFGKPICANQGVQWMLADMATRVEAARLLTYNAALLKAQGNVRFSKEAAMAKLYASECASYVSSKAVQLHGGIGYTPSYPVERMMRDAKITEIYDGTSEVQRMVIASSLLR